MQCLWLIAVAISNVLIANCDKSKIKKTIFLERDFKNFSFLGLLRGRVGLKEEGILK
jgi:hypothetical protein